MRIGHAIALRWGMVLLLALCLSAIEAGAGYRRINAPNPDDPMAVAIFELDNGLQVFITENHETRRIYLEIAVRAGSKHDPPETTGLAHYFEHLMFKGSENLGTLDYAQEKPLLDRIEELYEKHFHETDPEIRRDIYREIDAVAQEAAQFAIPNELDRVYKAMGGGALNAHTWVEETVFKVSIPANRLRQWAAIESDRFDSPVFRLFPTELETVYEEKNRSMDNKVRTIREAVDQLLYKKHPYGQETTLGRPEHLKNPSIRNIRNFFDIWYAPNNMAICISGSVDTQEAIEVIAEYFSGFEPRKLPKQKTWREAKLKGREHVSVNYEGEEFVLLAFRTAPRGHKDAEALNLLDMVLYNATAGLINLNLNQRQRVREAGAYPLQHNDYGAQYLYGIPKDGQSLEEVEQLLLEQIELLKQGEFEDWILPAIINEYKKSLKASLESDTARVSMLSRAFIAFEPWDRAIGTIQRMEKLTKKDVVRVAKKYFGKNYVAGFRRDAPREIQHIEKPEITTIQIDPTRQSAFAHEILAMPYTPMEPIYVDPDKDYRVVEDPLGFKLYYAENPINDLFSLRISIDFGAHQDNTISPAVMLLDKSGAGDLSPEDLKKEWYKLGTDFGIGAGDNETGISLYGLDENFEASLALMMKVMNRPTTDPDTLEEMKKIMLVQREDAKKQGDSISSALIQFNRYAEDSAFLRLLPEARLRALTVDQLHEITRNLLGYKHSYAYSGSLPLDTVLEAIRKHYTDAEPLRDPPPYRLLGARRPEGPEIYLFDKELAQSRVRIEFGSVTYDAALEPSIQMFNNYFAGGMAGIVFQELREARGLAYAAGASYLTGYRKEDENLMVGGIETQADKVAEALEAFIELFDRLPVSEERFAIAREALLNQYRTAKTGFREVIGAVRAWERKGLSADPRRERYEAIQAATFENLLEFHRQYIADRPKLISVVGDKTKMDLDRLKEMGSIREVRLEEIFID
jgi:predicted Zn-dependent peptidase